MGLTFCQENNQNKIYSTECSTQVSRVNEYPVWAGGQLCPWLVISKDYVVQCVHLFILHFYKQKVEVQPS